MKRILFFLLLAAPLHLLAQQQKLKGTITDTAGRPLDGATVSLWHGGKAIITQYAGQGHYSFDIDTLLSYQLAVSLIGYKPQTIDVRFPVAAALKIMLFAESIQLAEIVVAQKKPIIERRADRVIFNVESPIAAGGTWLDAIAKSPGVQVSSSGGISASNRGVTVYIDDRPVRLSGDDLSAYLQSIPADQASRIEIMSNPPAKYEAQGGAIINIVSKKIKGDGFNSGLNGGFTQGQKVSAKAGALFNYTRGKWNAYGNYGYSDRSQRRALNNDILYLSAGSSSLWDINKVLLPNASSHNYTFGLDFNLSPSQVFGILVTGNNSNNTNNSTALTTVNNPVRPAPDSLLNTFNRNAGTTRQYSFNLNYKIKLEKHGASLNADVDYVPYHNSSQQSVDNTVTSASGILISSPYQSFSPSRQDIDIWSAKLDYQMHLNKRLELEAGLKYNTITTRNRFDYFDVLGERQVFDPRRSDFFRYTEQTAAAYGSLAGHLGKLEVNAGLRAEQTFTRGFSYVSDSLNKNNYLRLFPTLFLSYLFSEESVLGLNFARRIDRPGYGQLNPARIYVSPYAYSSGNPFLLPSTSTNIELNYTFKQKYTLTGSYYIVTNLTSPLTVQDNTDHTIYTTQENTGSIRDIGLRLMTTNNPTRWWETNNYLEGYARTQDLLNQTGRIENSFHFFIKSDNALTLSKENGLKAEISTWYVGPLQQGTFHLSRTWDISMGISKSFWNKAATLRLAANDLFFSNPIRIKIDYLNQHTGFLYKNDSRNAVISFTYRIGKNVNEARKRKTAAEEEKLRNH